MRGKYLKEYWTTRNFRDLKTFGGPTDFLKGKITVNRLAIIVTSRPKPFSLDLHWVSQSRELGAKHQNIQHWNLIMGDHGYKCQYCGRDDFRSNGGLTQHIKKNEHCAKKARAWVVGRADGYESGLECMPCMEVLMPNKRKNGADECIPSGFLAQKQVRTDSLLCVDSFDYTRMGHNHREYDDDIDGTMYDVNGGDDSTQDGPAVDSDGELVDDDSVEPDTTIKGNYDVYCDHFSDNYSEYFTAKEVTAIKIMNSLRQTKASLDTYEAVMKWHFREIGEIRDHETLGSTTRYISRQVLFKKLFKRYNIDKNAYSVVKEITLPSSKAKARIVTNDARAVIQSLLTDPRIRDEDYLFFNDDPFAPPPPDLDYIGDLNTGQSYSKTYAKLITKPGKQVLLPVPFYIDGAVTGQFSLLTVTAVKFTLGIFTRKARDRPHMWRTMGYIPTVHKNKSRGHRIMANSGHADAQMRHQDALDDEGDHTAGPRAHPSQDYHTILATILESFVHLQETGFVWDLFYRGKEYKDVEFVPFVPFIKCDTEEGDKLCGKYLSRGRGVKNLCRYCECPAAMTDRPTAKYQRKTAPKISMLVEQNDLVALKNISQQAIKNSMYLLRFGLHSEEGIHGACPLEMLHAILLGMFMYTRDGFFRAVGECSEVAQDINALAIEYGEVFCRQSDRDMPKTKFTEGIRRGKLQAKEYTGILLVLAAVLRSTLGRAHLRKAKGEEGAEIRRLRDWSMLVETLLQWESWLKSDRLDKNDVKRSEKKHRYIMYLVRKISKRDKKMGLKIMKFHGISHMTRDIINFGVPMEFDTGSNEAGHKPTKACSKLTQKRPDTFDLQLATRLLESMVLEMAMEEIERGNKMWNYHQGYRDSARDEPKTKDPYLGGARFTVNFCEEDDKYKLHMTSRSTRQSKMLIEDDFVKFVAKLQEKTSDHGLDSLSLYSNHYRKGLVFRGTSNHQGEVWRDWVMVDWGDDYGSLPCKIWGFVNLSDLPPGNNITIGGLSDVDPAIYAIVESSEWVEDEAEVGRSEIFVPIMKVIGGKSNGNVTKLRFFLADVEAFQDPMVVIPDIGGPPNAYFVCKNRETWRNDFVEWLREPHEHDAMSDSEDEISDQEDWDPDSEEEEEEEEGPEF